MAVEVDCILEIQHILDCQHLGYIYFNTQNGIEEKNATRSPSITDPHTLVFGRAPFPLLPVTQASKEAGDLGVLGLYREAPRFLMNPPFKILMKTKISS